MPEAILIPVSSQEPNFPVGISLGLTWSETDLCAVVSKGQVDFHPLFWAAGGLFHPGKSRLMGNCTPLLIIPIPFHCVSDALAI